jgi:hypothetical protein
MPDLPLVEAAGYLGLTTEALRKRIQRGSAPGYKRDGQWFATLPESPAPVPDSPAQTAGQTEDTSGHASSQAPETASHAPGQPPEASSHVAGQVTEANGHAAPPDAAASAGEFRRLEELVALLREELAERRRELHEEQEARRREVQQLHTLLAQAQQRALPAPRAWAPGAVDGPAGSPPVKDMAVAGASAPVDRRPWWRFW